MFLYEHKRVRRFSNLCTFKIKTLALAEKANERILSRGKENELIKQHELIEKRLSEINELKNQGQEVMLENDKWGNKFRRVGKQIS